MKNFKFRLRTKIRHKIKTNRRVIDFNKEILIGEVGALVGAPLFGFLGSILISKSPTFIPIATLVGSILGGTTSMLIARIHDEKKYKTFSAKKLVRDITLYTPAAFLIAGLVSYPVLIFVTHSVFLKQHIAYLSSFIGELSSFIVFLIIINIYRYALSRLLNKELG
jgi:uncharacterized membrane protein YeaQ/YmgE (transglycosylase-associated protein family)